jgi:hypothetical protein
MSAINDENPYSSPISNQPTARPKRLHVRPILSGVIAIIIATIVSRGGLLIPAILGVGSWWLYKFWPRKTAPDDIGARAFLERLENSPTTHGVAREGSERVSPEQPLDEFRNLRL